MKLAFSLKSGILLLVVLVIYHNALDCQFVFDDLSAIRDNADIRSESPWTNLVYNDFWGTPIEQEKSHKSYRPLTVLTYKINFMIGGLNPMGYHLINLILHWAVSVQIYIMLYYVLKYNDLMSYSAALLFSVHPVHTEAVTGVVGRAELLSAFFALLAFMMYVRIVSSSSWFGMNSYFIIAALILLATLSKEQGITIAGVCVLYDFIVMQKIGIHDMLSLGHALLRKEFTKLSSDLKEFVKRFLLLTLAVAFIMTLRFSVMGSQLPVFTRFDNPATGQTTPYRQLTYNYLLVVNSWLLITPAWLCCDWTMRTIPLIESLLDIRNLYTMLLYAAVFVISYFCLCKRDSFRDQIYVGLIILVLPFIPASNLFFPVGFVVAERVLYIPSIGYCILLAAVFNHLFQSADSSRFSKFGVVFSVTFLIFAGCLRTYTRNNDWKSDYHLFTSALKFTEDNAKIWNNIGHALEAEGRNEEALKYYRNASITQPDDIGSHINVGRILKLLGKYAEAEKALKSALELLPPVIPGQPYTARLAPSHLNVFITLASLISLNGTRDNEVILLYKRAISMREDFVQAYINYGEFLLTRGRHEEAISQFNTALLYDRKNADLFYNLGVVYLDQKKHPQAINNFNMALQLNPLHKQALYNSAVMIQESGQSSAYTQAVNRVNKVIELDPKNEKAHFTAALLATDMKNFNRAKLHFEKSLEINPEFKGALFNLALLLANEMNSPAESLPYLKKCIELYPDHTKSYLLLGDIAINHLKNLDLAEKSFQEILRIEPQNVQGRHNLCVVYAERGELIKAEKCLSEIAGLHPSEKYIHDHLQIIRNKIKQFNKSTP